MINDITIGQYYPTDSVIHKLDPRTKIVSAFLYMIFLFTVNNVWGYLAAFIFLAAVVSVSKIPAGYVIKGIKGILFIMLLTVVINMFWTPGEIVWQWKFLKITKEGIQLSFNMAFRLVLLISGTSMMTLCTDTISLTDGMEELIKKMPFVGKYAHELSMMMSIALRFIPTLTEETDRIMKAQKSRGADFETGGIFARAKGLIPILVPLFVSAFQRANELAMAMEARCYRGAEGRTRLRELKYTKGDFAAYGIVVLCMAAIFATRFVAF